MAYGVKKPLDQKQVKIKQLEENSMRYYPNDRYGNVDEWGAVIKHQTEVYNRDVEL